MTNMRLGDSTLGSLIPSVNTPFLVYRFGELTLSMMNNFS